MKHIFIGVLCGFAVLSCASKTDDIHTSEATQNATFSCDQGGTISALYSADGSEAILDIKLVAQHIDVKNIHLNQAISGSGARYINKKNNVVEYEWHTKADFALLSITLSPDRTISVSCHLN
ncbi:MliC family protein [Shewanella sp. OMA3-2]|uniref:MliC family protein n=1 Tax=Shewanella sp. OMA3-2 TaxID=2908650 RepID=UPI001F4554BD|nr:MliC family protein [Shewanella sp. OMA3-2]UJF20799.1 MliC family protein [Shewanella sp. OMA3-2]